MISAETEAADLCVIGAGAAGLATAIFTARAAGTLRIVCVPGLLELGRECVPCRRKLVQRQPKQCVDF